MPSYCTQQEKNLVNRNSTTLKELPVDNQERRGKYYIVGARYWKVCVIQEIVIQEIRD